MRYRVGLLAGETYDVTLEKLDDYYRWVMRRGYDVLVGRAKPIYGVWWVYLGDVTAESNIPVPPNPIPTREEERPAEEVEEEMAGFAPGPPTGWIPTEVPAEVEEKVEEVKPPEELISLPAPTPPPPPEPWYVKYKVPLTIGAIGAAIGVGALVIRRLRRR